MAVARVTKVFGPPGTGKTTRLLSIVEEAIKQGVKSERIAYVAFTRKAAHEAVTRAMAKFNLPEERFPYFRTLHSLAFKQLGISREEILHDEHYKELGERLGFPFSTLEEASLVPMGTALGDKVARIESLARLRNVSLETQWHDSNERDCPWDAVKQWDAGVKRFKASRGFFDYTDLLEQYNHDLDVDLFIVDEAQDLSPLQWQVVRRACARSGKVYLAGDDDQAIYGWAGADVSRFLGIKGDTLVLPQSYRLPKTIQRLAQAVVERISRRQAKVWAPREEDGAVDYTRYESSLDLLNGKSWLLLARNRSQLRRFEKVAINIGIPYRIEGKHSTDVPAVHALLAWERGRKGAELPPDAINGLWHFLDREPLRIREPAKLADLLRGPEAARLAQPWFNALAIPPAQREYIRACLANKHDLLAEPQVQLATIHRSKGGEADCVGLITDLSLKPWQQLATDDEQRVLYVGLTRAKERLTIIEPQGVRYYRI